MAKRGRKLIQIDWDQFEKLCQMQSTLEEISGWFNCSEDTIERAVKRKYLTNFADIYKKKSSRGKISLRRKMFETAMDGNVTMQIFLSKQLLGYRDNPDPVQDTHKPYKPLDSMRDDDDDLNSDDGPAVDSDKGDNSDNEF
jgi:hypothetical protein